MPLPPNAYNSINQSALERRLGVVVETAISSGKIVGCVILVAHRGTIIYQSTSGFADRENGKPVTLDTIFRFASMTKALVSASALILCEKGVIELDDVVTNYLPSFQPKHRSDATCRITLRQLLTHTAGLAYGFVLPPDNEPYASLQISDGIDNPGISLVENLRRLADAELLFAPGSAFLYSLATDVLGAVLEIACDQPLASIVKSQVTEPLCMVDTDFVIKDRSRFACAYADSLVPGEAARLMPDYLTLRKADAGIVHYAPARAFDQNAYHSGGAGMVGTAPDYLKFLEAIRQGGAPILSNDSVKLMTEDQIPHLLVGEPGLGFGLGFGVVRDPVAAATPKNIGSFGWGGIYGTTYWVDPLAELSVVALTNTTLEGVDGNFRTDVIDAVYSV
ncbi:MAG: serine hydrolase [Candidatus Obscuribacterales bacterium]|nr:serine hydrolase [Candidatus Obscuribacterales bacterium]